MNPTTPITVIFHAYQPTEAIKSLHCPACGQQHSIHDENGLVCCCGTSLSILIRDDLNDPLKLIEQIENLQMEVSDLEAARDNLQDDNASLIDDLKETAEENARQERELVAAERKISDLEHDLKQRDQTLNDANNTSAQLKDDNETLKEQPS